MTLGLTKQPWGEVLWERWPAGWSHFCLRPGSVAWLCPPPGDRSLGIRLQDKGAHGGNVTSSVALTERR